MPLTCRCQCVTSPAGHDLRAQGGATIMPCHTSRTGHTRAHTVRRHEVTHVQHIRSARASVSESITHV